MIFIQSTSHLGQAFALILTHLCALVGHHAGRLPAAAALLSLVHWRLMRIAARLDRLAKRWQDNTLPKPRASRARQTRPDRVAPPRIPSGKIWLIRLLQPTAQFTGQVEAFLADPQTRAFVLAAPQAGRLLRPLCRGLGVPQPPWLELPARPPRPARKPPAAPASRAAATHPAVPPTPDRPIPRNILAAARYWRKKLG